MNNKRLVEMIKTNGQHDRIIAMKATWEKKRGQKKLYTISVKIPLLQDSLIDFLCNEGFFLNRSEFIRKSIDESLTRQLDIIERQSKLIHDFNIQVKTHDEI